MKLFQMTQKKLATLGFIANQNKPHHFNKHHVRAIFIAALTICSDFVYIFKEADSADEYMRSFFMAITIIGINISYVATVFKTTELYNLIENTQTITTKSE